MKKLFLLLLLFAAAAVAGIVYLQRQELVISLSEADLQERADEAFPVEQRYLVLLTLRLSDPAVNLVEGSDRIHYAMRASLNIAGMESPLTGSAAVSGSLRYDAETRNLYLDQARVDDLDIAGVPSQYRTAVRETANLAVRQQLGRRPVYTVEEELFARLPGVVELRNVQVRDGRLRISLGLTDRFWTRLWPPEEGT